MKRIFLLLLFLFIANSSLFSRNESLKDSLKALLEDASGKERIDLLSDYAHTTGAHPVERRKIANQIISESEKLNYTEGIIQGKAHFAYSYYFEDNFEKAAELFQEVYDIASENNFKYLTAINAHRLANCFHKLDQNERAAFYFKKAITIWGRLPDLYNNDYYHSANNLGLLYWRTGKFDSSIIYYRLAERLAENMHDKRRAAATNNNMGVIYWQWGILDLAIKHYSTSLMIRKETGDSAGIAKVYNNIGLAYLEYNKLNDGEKYIRDALSISTSISDIPTQAYSLNALGKVYLEKKDFNKAHQSFLKSLELYKSFNNDDGMLLNYNDLACVLIDLGKPEEALKYARTSLKLGKEKELPERINVAFRNMGNAYIKSGNYSTGIKYLDSAFTIASVTGAKSQLKDIYKSYADVYKVTRNLSKYAENLDLYYQTKESILNEKFRNQLLEFQTRLETIEAQQKLKEKEYQLQLSKFMLYAVAGLLVLMIIIALVIYKINVSRKKAYVTLNKKNAELDNLNLMKDKLLSVIAHDLKNPMANVLGYSDLLMSDYDEMSEDEIKEGLEGIHVSIQSVFYLLNNLLTWARSQRGLIKIQNEEFEICDVINRTTENAKLPARDKNITLLSKCEEMIIQSDRFVVETVVNNLVMNAVKFTLRNGKIEISGEKTDNSFIVCVEDNGIGMTEEQTAGLFAVQSSNETQGTNAEKGTGLGLLICKDLIEKIGGKITVESEPDKGSKFKVEIPNEKKN